MKILFCVLAVLAAAAATTTPQSGKVLCYYDSKSYVREAQARMLPVDLDPGLAHCSHIVYGFAGIQPDTYKAVSLNENLDIDSNYANYKQVINFKSKHPGLRALLSIGGDADIEDGEKYNLLLESTHARTAFVNSAVHLSEYHGFDGIDLAWQFPRTKPKKVRSTLDSIWHGIKKTFRTTPVDEKEAEHREGFTALVRELKAAMSVKSNNKELVITVLPNVNASIYFDVKTIIGHVDMVNLHAFDYQTPERNPKEADYYAPIYAPQNRNPDLNVDADVNYWLRSGAPSNKLIIGIPTYARTWKLDKDSDISGVPPLHADGPGEPGSYQLTDGMLSYPEVCSKLITPAHQKGMKPYLTKVTDPGKRFGNYAFRLPDHGESGLWVSYEDPETAGDKAAYAKSKNLGGVSILDVSTDDFRGLCTGDKFPITKAAKSKL